MRIANLNPDEQWEILRRQSIDMILTYMAAKEPEKLAHKVKVATTSLSAYTRHEQTLSAREATRVMVARSLSESPEQFKEYLKVAMPTLKLSSPVSE